jgi:hypothetical protein
MAAFLLLMNSRREDNGPPPPSGPSDKDLKEARQCAERIRLLLPAAEQGNEAACHGVWREAQSLMMLEWIDSIEDTNFLTGNERERVARIIAPFLALSEDQSADPSAVAFGIAVAVLFTIIIAVASVIYLLRS